MSEMSKGRKLAEAAFKKVQKLGRSGERSEARQEYDAEADASRTNTARLKELRLARDAADNEASRAATGKAKNPRKD